MCLSKYAKDGTTIEPKAHTNRFDDENDRLYAPVVSRHINGNTLRSALKAAQGQKLTERGIFDCDDLWVAKLSNQVSLFSK